MKTYCLTLLYPSHTKMLLCPLKSSLSIPQISVQVLLHYYSIFLYKYIKTSVLGLHVCQ